MPLRTVDAHLHWNCRKAVLLWGSGGLGWQPEKSGDELLAYLQLKISGGRVGEHAGYPSARQGGGARAGGLVRASAAVLLTYALGWTAREAAMGTRARGGHLQRELCMCHASGMKLGSYMQRCGEAGKVAALPARASPRVVQALRCGPLCREKRGMQGNNPAPNFYSSRHLSYIARPAGQVLSAGFPARSCATRQQGGSRQCAQLGMWSPTCYLRTGR